jgi:hypothetical protein
MEIHFYDKYHFRVPVASGVFSTVIIFIFFYFSIKPRTVLGWRRYKLLGGRFEISFIILVKSLA